MGREPAILGGGYNGWGYKSVKTLTDGSLELIDHPKPARTASPEVKDRSYATTVAQDSALDFIERNRAGDKPYFLEIATYGPHSSLKRAWPDEPIFPPAFQDRPSKTNPEGNCGLVECSDLTSKDLVGYDDPREDNAPTYLGRKGKVSPPRPGGPTRSA